MIIEGQGVHRGLHDGVGMALMADDRFRRGGNCLGGSLMDYLLPSALEVPDWQRIQRDHRPTTRLEPKGWGMRDRRLAPAVRQRRIMDALKPVRPLRLTCRDPIAAVGGHEG